MSWGGEGREGGGEEAGAEARGGGGGSVWWRVGQGMHPQCLQAPRVLVRPPPSLAGRAFLSLSCPLPPTCPDFCPPCPAMLCCPGHAKRRRWRTSCAHRRRRRRRLGLRQLGQRRSGVRQHRYAGGEHTHISRTHAPCTMHHTHIHTHTHTHTFMHHAPHPHIHAPCTTPTHSCTMYHTHTFMHHAPCSIIC